MQVLTRFAGLVLLLGASMALSACGGGGSDNSRSVMPSLLTGTSGADPDATHWQSNVGTDQSALSFSLYADGSGDLFIGNVEGTMFTNDDINNSRSSFLMEWAEPSNGTVVITRVPDTAGFLIRLTNIEVNGDESGFTARATAYDDDFLEMGFTRINSPLVP